MTFRIFKRGKVYHYRFQVKPFKRIQRSTKDGDKARARAVAQRAYDDAVLRSNGGNPLPTLSGLIEEWKALRAPVASQSYVRTIETFERSHLYDLGPLLITDLTTERIERARNQHLVSRAPASVNHWLSLLKMLVRWAIKRKMLPALPWDVARMREQKKPRVTLPAASTAEWLAAVDAKCGRNPSVATAVRLMYGIGLREDEAATARWEWIDWERGNYTPGKTKGREAVPLRLPTWLRDYLQERHQHTGLIAPHPKGRVLPAGYAYRVIRAANQACGLHGITPHRLRGTYATRMSEEGVPVQTIQYMLRHKAPATTMRYLEVDMEVAGGAQERMADKSNLGRKNGAHQPANPHRNS